MAQNHSPFLDPLWRRIALVAFCACWAGFEMIWGDAFWATIAAGMTVYGAWSFLINYKIPAESPPERPAEKE